MARRLPRSLFCVILACASLPAGVLAAELGEARVVSHIGQQLVAEIELTALHDETAPVQARLASADIYRGAAIAMPPVLSGLNLSVVRRGGRQFLKLASQGPVQSEYLHLYFELADGTERSVRLATLWLTPDPDPVPKPAPEPIAAKASSNTALSTSFPRTREPIAGSHLRSSPEVRQAQHGSPLSRERRDNLAALGPEPEPKPAHERKAEPKTALKPSPALASAPGLAFTPKPAMKPVAATAAPAVHAAPVQASKLAAHAQAVQAPKPKTAVAHVPGTGTKVAPPVAPAPLPMAAARPASCPRPDPAALKTCVALDYKNAQLNAQLGQLEDKVKVLQLAMGTARAGGNAPPPAPHLATATARAVPYAAKPKIPVQPPEPAFPYLWLALGGAVLLAGAGAAVFLVRRKAAREREDRVRRASLPPIMPGVKNRLMPDQSAVDEATNPADSAHT